MATGSQENMWALVNAFGVLSEYRERRWTNGFDRVDLLMCRTNEWIHAVLQASFVFSSSEANRSHPSSSRAPTCQGSADAVSHGDE
jgi:hypothetical protein